MYNHQALFEGLKVQKYSILFLLRKKKEDKFTSKSSPYCKILSITNKISLSESSSLMSSG